jgi:hypothetical protein
MGELRVLEKGSLTRLFFFACIEIEQVMQNNAAWLAARRAEKDTRQKLFSFFGDILALPETPPQTK